MEEGKEKIRAVMVSRTPGGGGGERRWQQPASQRCDATNRAHDELSGTIRLIFSGK